MKRPPVDVLILGAGAAGLAAARDLSLAGLRVILLEGRSRVGGRILTLQIGSRTLPIELGAEFIHGEAPETEALCTSGRLIVDRVSGAHLQSRGGIWKPASDFWGTVDRFSRTLSRRFSGKNALDRSFSDAVAKARLPQRDRDLLLQYARGFQGADPRLLSARSIAEEGAEASDRQSRVVSGYDALLDQVRSESDPECIDLRLDTVATAVQWTSKEVRVHARTAAGRGKEVFQGKACVIALPHAVLKSGSLLFDPELKDRGRLLQGLEVAQVFKIVLRFRVAFWENGILHRGPSGDSSPLGFLHAPGEDVPVWWTAEPARSPVLTGWAGGPDAVPLLQLDESSRVERCLQSLSRTLSLPRARMDSLLEQWWTYDWSKDPFSQGAYSYVGVGGARCPEALARPVRDRLFFAGDYMAGGSMGTVEGAIAGGRRAARQLLESHP